MQGAGNETGNTKAKAGAAMKPGTAMKPATTGSAVKMEKGAMKKGTESPAAESMKKNESPASPSTSISKEK